MKRMVTDIGFFRKPKTFMEKIRALIGTELCVRDTDILMLSQPAVFHEEFAEFVKKNIGKKYRVIIEIMEETE